MGRMPRRSALVVSVATGLAAWASSRAVDPGVPPAPPPQPPLPAPAPDPAPAPASTAAPGTQPAAKRSPNALSGVIKALAPIAAPPALVTALALYFGVVKTNFQLAYFGIDGTLVSYSNQEYLLRSVDALFYPLAGIVVAGLLLVWAHRAVLLWIKDPATDLSGRALRTATWVMGLVGGALFALGAVQALDPLPWDPPYLVAPLSLGAGVLLLAYGVYLSRMRVDRHAAELPEELRWVAPASLVLVGTLVLVSLFWATREYAVDRAVRTAHDVEVALPFKPAAVVFSRQPLGLEAPGVVESDLGDGVPYRFRYQGLRLVGHNEGRFFLVPASWSRAEGVTFVLADSDELRVEFRQVAG
jgi:hypothetical protein